LNNFSNNRLLFVLLLFIVASCGKKKVQEPYGKLLATVYDQELYASEVGSALGNFNSPEDSILAVKEFVNAWIKQTILLHKAENVLSDDEKDKTLELDQYLNDLLIYELQQKLIAQKLDTSISDIEINRYYENNKSNFELKENIVQMIFFKLPTDIKGLDKMWSQFQRGNQNDLEELTFNTVENNGNFFRDEDVWLSFDDVVKEIPITTYNQENYLNNNKLIKLSDNKYTYFVKILNFKIRNSSSPLEFERERIRNIILNKRKVAMLIKYEEDLKKDAEINNKIKIF
jgi:Trp operon repressor